MGPLHPMRGPPKTGETLMRNCRATNRQGNPCRQTAIPGGTVCVYDGGAAPQVKAAAERRLLAAVDPAITALVELLQDAERDSDRLRAITLILDRAGITQTQQVDVLTASFLEAEIARMETELGVNDAA